MKTETHILKTANRTMAITITKLRRGILLKCTFDKHGDDVDRGEKAAFARWLNKVNFAGRALQRDGWIRELSDDSFLVLLKD